MIEHTDYDTGKVINVDYKLPDNIQNISFSYDGGRLYISINNKEIYKNFSATRDCCVEITR